MSNHLATETSPYLRQHADNPVDWYPWGEEALSRARAEDKPILLSIGYSACHWCHVMAHESFEDPDAAAVMNRLFINIKVDREERPDLDHIYQAAHQLLTQRAGGWPLNMFLSPDGVPFYGGTYFPKAPRYGLPGFMTLLERVAEAWREEREAIEEQNASMLATFEQLRPEPGQGGQVMDDAPIQAARRQLEAQFDRKWGGFGGAPKFPHPTDLALLLAAPEARYRDIALFTLKRMAEGGIFDQLGGGFCRYSVDAEWNIPHFEKMLYDNGQLLKLYADAWGLTGEAVYSRVAAMTADWAVREMRAPGGGFCSALDADSEGKEGSFYVWRREEVQALLSQDEYAAFAPVYGLDGPPNFEGEAWHLRLVDGEEDNDGLERIRAKLLAARGRRMRPGCDDKILAGWNGLMIEGLLRAGRRLGRDDWVGAGQESLDFIRAALWRDGKLLAACDPAGRGHLNAYLDDYAFLLAACLESLQARFRLVDLDFARGLADALLQRFEDPAGGGFYFTSHDHERLVHRAKIGHDGATPAGNGVAALALQRLAALCGEPRYGEAAGRVLALYHQEFQASTVGHASLLAALGEWLRPSPQVVMQGPATGLEEWRRRFAPGAPETILVLAIPEGLEGLPKNLCKPRQNHVNAWVCEGVNCLPPIDQPSVLDDWFAQCQKGH